MNFIFINNLKLIFLKLIKKLKINYLTISYNIIYYLFFFFYKINFKNIKNINNDYFIINNKCNFLIYEILFFIINKRKIKNILIKKLNFNINNIILISIKNNIIKNNLVKKINIFNNKIWFLKKISFRKIKNICIFNFFLQNTIIIFKSFFNIFNKKIIKKKFNFINWNTIGPIDEFDIVNLKKSFKLSINNSISTIIFCNIFKKNNFYIKNKCINYFIFKKINFKIKNKYIIYYIKNYFFFFLNFVKILIKFNNIEFNLFIKNICKNLNFKILKKKNNIFSKNIYLFKPFNYLEKIISINLILKIKKKSNLILFKNNIKKNIFINIKNIIKGCYELTFNYFKTHIIIISSSYNLEIIFCCYFYLKKYFNIKILSIYCVYLFSKQNKYYKNKIFKNKIIIVNNIINFKNNTFLLNYNFKNIKKKNLIKNLIKICLFVIKL